MTSSLDTNKKVKMSGSAEVKGKFLLKKFIQGFVTTETIGILPYFSTAGVCALRLIALIRVEV